MCTCVFLCVKLIGSTKKDVKRRNIERKLFFDRANASAVSHCLQSRLNAFRKRLSIRLIVIYFCKKYKTVNGEINDQQPRGSCFIQLVYHAFLIEYGYKKRGGGVRVDLFVINNIFKDLKKDWFPFFAEISPFLSSRYYQWRRTNYSVLLSSIGI